MENILGQIKELVKSRVKEEYIVELLNPDVELASLGFDSLKIVAFVLELERVFLIEFPPEMISESTFKSIGTVVDVVEHLIERANKPFNGEVYR